MPTNNSDAKITQCTDGSQGKSTSATPTDSAAAKPPLNFDKKKKKRGSFGLFKAALSMLRRQTGDKEAKKSIARLNSAPANGNWKNLVGSVRPLHLNEIDQSPTPSISPESPAPSERIEDFVTTPASPAPSFSCTMSQYASAPNLRDLVDSSDDEEDDPDEVFDAITGDDMIDAKAEEFIAQFYKQIQLQNTATIHHRRQRTI